MGMLCDQGLSFQLVQHQRQTLPVDAQHLYTCLRCPKTWVALIQFHWSHIAKEATIAAKKSAHSFSRTHVGDQGIFIFYCSQEITRSTFLNIFNEPKQIKSYGSDRLLVTVWATKHYFRGSAALAMNGWNLVELNFVVFCWSISHFSLIST